MNSKEPNLSSRPTQVEVLKELPKVSMVNTSLKKLKYHLACFDVVVKERTTATAIIEGTWGFEHIKACFRDEIVPFVKALKDLFNLFDQVLIDELSEVQNVFYQMKQAVEQHRGESNRFQAKMNKVLNENERLLEQATSKDIVNIVVTFTMDNAYEPVHECEKYIFIKKLKERIKSLSGNIKEEKIKQELEDIETINIELDHTMTKLIAENEHLKQTYKQLYDSIKLSCIRSKEQCDDLIKQVNKKSAENSDLNASLQEKVLVITALKDTLIKIKGKVVVDEVVILHPIDPELLKIDVAPLAPKLRNNRTARYDYLKHTQEETATLREIVEHARSINPLNTSLYYVVQIVLWYLDSGCSKHMTEDRSQLTNFVNKFLELTADVEIEGDHCLFDMTKPLPLKGCPSHLTIAVEYFFNNDLESLKSSDLEKNYTTSITKTKVARYEIVGIEDLTHALWSTIKHWYDKDAKNRIKHWGERRKLWYRSQGNKISMHNVYSPQKILGVKSVSIKKLHGYGHLEKIVVKRADQQLYKFKEGDFVDLHLNDIEDMLLLLVKHKLFHLDGSDIVDFIVALHMFTRSLIIKRRVEDLQLGVESYQKKLNITKPHKTFPEIEFKELYTPSHKPPGKKIEYSVMKLIVNSLIIPHHLKGLLRFGDVKFLL
nr:hypothetical protein [Tanacetum cinerariifolium]